MHMRVTGECETRKLNTFTWHSRPGVHPHPLHSSGYACFKCIDGAPSRLVTLLTFTMN